MTRSEEVTIDEAELVRSTDLIVIYRVDGREVRIPPLHIRPGTTASQVGQKGALVLPRWFAQELGLVARR